MFNIVLYEPEIPPNTGNILRLAANTGCRLHLIKPLGFRLNERSLRRSGLDYGDISDMLVHEDWQALRERLPAPRVLAVSTRGTLAHPDCRYQPDDILLFGPETRGLPSSMLDALPETQKIRIPMVPGSRSLNLANAVAVVVYEAWRQLGHPGAATTVRP